MKKDDFDQQQFEENEKLTKDLRDEFESIIRKVEKIRGTSKLFYVHIVDKRHFKDYEDNRKLIDNVKKWINKMYGNLRLNQSIILVGDSVLAYGYPPFIEDKI